ncbi:MAG: glycosyltransferase [Planctomycetota bacterium]|jgi:glycosyltransferase involved in cell wall biosynthesis
MKSKTALICTTYNCRDELEDALEMFTSESGLESLDEIVIVDGGSNDGTWELLKEWAERAVELEVYQVPGANIPRGRNEAIKRTDAQIIVTFDSGTRYNGGWLRLMLKPFEDEQVSVVGGLSVSHGETLFEECFAAFDERKRTDPLLGPSHRAIAYRRKVWEQIGGYPEDVDGGEDTESCV